MTTFQQDMKQCHVSKIKVLPGHYLHGGNITNTCLKGVHKVQ